jgi:hypothetical protein
VTARWRLKSRFDETAGLLSVSLHSATPPLRPCTPHTTTLSGGRKTRTPPTTSGKAANAAAYNAGLYAAARRPRVDGLELSPARATLTPTCYQR